MEEQVRAAGSGTPRLWIARIAAVVFVIVVIGIAFVLGRLGRNDAQRRAAELEREVQLLHVHRVLGVAAYEASRANFANASTGTTRFYLELDALRQNATELSPASEAIFDRIRGQRDSITTQLARTDPAAARALADAYIALNAVIQEQQQTRLRRAAPRPSR